MKFNKLWILLFMSMTLFYACSSDDDAGSGNPDTETPVDAPYAQGIFVTNEGQFPNAGSVSFISEDLETSENNVFENVNNADPGSVIQSMFFDDNDRAYIIANNSNMITVVNRYTMEQIGFIDAGLEMPRYGVAVNGKAYVTNQSSNMAYVAVINLDNLQVESLLYMDDGSVEDIKVGNNGMVYVQNAAFGTGHKIVVIDPSTDELTDEVFETSEGLNGMDIDQNHLYAITNSDLEIFDFNGNNTATIDLNETPSKIAVKNETIYYTVGNAVYQMNSTDTSAPDEALFTYYSDSDYGVMYGFAVHNNKVFVADAGDFASDSYVEVYDADGNFLKKINVGISPNGFYFND